MIALVIHYKPGLHSHIQRIAKKHRGLQSYLGIRRPVTRKVRPRGSRRGSRCVCISFCHEDILIYDKAYKYRGHIAGSAIEGQSTFFQPQSTSVHEHAYYYSHSASEGEQAVTRGELRYQMPPMHSLIVRQSRFLPSLFSRSSRKAPTPQSVQASASHQPPQPIQAPSEPISHAHTHPPAEAKPKHGSNSTKYMLYPQNNPQSSKAGLDDPRARSREAPRTAVPSQPNVSQSAQPPSMPYPSLSSSAMNPSRPQANAAASISSPTSAPAYTTWSPPPQDPYRLMQSPLSSSAGLQSPLHHVVSPSYPSASLPSSNQLQSQAPNIPASYTTQRVDTATSREERQIPVNASNGSPGQTRKERSSLEQARLPPPTTQVSNGYTSQNYPSGAQQAISSHPGLTQSTTVPETYPSRPDLSKQPAFEQGRRPLQSPGLSIATTVDTAATTVTASNYQASVPTSTVPVNPSTGSREQMHGPSSGSAPVMMSTDTSKQSPPYVSPMSPPPMTATWSASQRTRFETDMGRPAPIPSVTSPAVQGQSHSQSGSAPGNYTMPPSQSQRGAVPGEHIECRGKDNHNDNIRVGASAGTSRGVWDSGHSGAGPTSAGAFAKQPNRDGAPRFPVVETPSTPSSGKTAPTPPFHTPSSHVMNQKALPPMTPQSGHAVMAAQPISHSVSSGKPNVMSVPAVQSVSSQSYSSGSHTAAGASRNPPPQVVHTSSASGPPTMPLSGYGPRYDSHSMASPPLPPYSSVASPNVPSPPDARTQPPPHAPSVSNANPGVLSTITHGFPPIAVPRNSSTDSSLLHQSRAPMPANKENTQSWFPQMVSRNPSRDSQDTKDTGSIRTPSLMGEAPVRRPSKLSKQPPKRSQTTPVPPAQPAAASASRRGRTVSDNESSRMDALQQLMSSRASLQTNTSGDPYGRRNGSSSSIAQAGSTRPPSAVPASRETSQERKKKSMFSRLFGSGQKSSDVRPQQTWYTSQQGSNDGLGRVPSQLQEPSKRESVLADMQRVTVDSKKDSKSVRPNVSSKGSVPPTLTIPLNIPPSTEKKSPAAKTFKPNFRFLAPKRHRTMSSASLDAVDGTAVSYLRRLAAFS
jgi:hypothetical protein